MSFGEEPMTQKTTNPWTFDVRVRERNLKAGTINDKDVDKYLGGLPDLAEHSEPFSASQPALATPAAVAAPAPAMDAGSDLGDVDDDEDDLDDGEAEAANVQNGAAIADADQNGNASPTE